MGVFVKQPQLLALGMVLQVRVAQGFESEICLGRSRAGGGGLGRGCVRQRLRTATQPAPRLPMKTYKGAHERATEHHAYIHAPHAAAMAPHAHPPRAVERKVAPHVPTTRRRAPRFRSTPSCPASATSSRAGSPRNPTSRLAWLWAWRSCRPCPAARPPMWWCVRACTCAWRAGRLHASAALCPPSAVTRP
jgi:hypothetical protein